jgi:hypothetical protein
MLRTFFRDGPVRVVVIAARNGDQAVIFRRPPVANLSHLEPFHDLPGAGLRGDSKQALNTPEAAHPVDS